MLSFYKSVVFICKMCFYTNFQDLKSAFSIFGEVVNVSIPIDKNTNRKRGFAFVEFEDYDSADKVASEFMFE